MAAPHEDAAPPRAPAVRAVELGLLCAAVTAGVLAVGPLGERRLDAYVLPKELLLHLGAAGAMAILALRGRAISVGRIEHLLGAGLAFGALAALFAVNLWLTLRPLALSLSAALLLVWARQQGEGRRRALLQAVAFAATASALAVFLESGTGLDAWSMPGRAPGGAAGNRNHAAHLLVIALPVLGYLLLTAANRREIALTLLGLAMCSGAVLVTRSRTAWLTALVLVALAAIAAALWRRSLWPQRARAGAAVLALVLGGLGAVLLPSELTWSDAAPYRSTFERLTEHDAGTGRGRLIQYQRTLELIASRPLLGVGPGHWAVAYPGVARPADPNVRVASAQPVNRLPNSDWLGLAAERGVPAAACFLAAGICLVLAAWRRRPPLAPALAAAGIGAAVAVLGSLDAVLQRPEPALACALALGALVPSPAAPARLLSRRMARLAPAVLAVVALVAAADSARRLAAHHLAEGGPAERVRAMRLAPGDYRLRCDAAMRAEANGYCATAARLARRALELNPALPRCEAIARACAGRADPPGRGR